VPVNGPEPTSGRETRLLALVVLVSLAVLLLLARFQFPEANIASVTPSPGPLAGMAARATFEEMAATLMGVLSRASAAVDVIRLETIPAARSLEEDRDPSLAPDAEPRVAAAGSAAAPGPDKRRGAALQPSPQASRRFAAALRVRPDLGLVHVPAGWRPAGLRDLTSPLEVVWSDPDREIAAVRLPSVPGGMAGLPASAAGVTGYLYVGLIQGTRSGPTIQPVFIGRADTETDARWSAPLVVLGGGAALPIGSLAYTIDGRLIGLVTGHEAGFAIVPAAALDDAVSRMAMGGATPE
jgi:hypothetical protein